MWGDEPDTLTRVYVWIPRDDYHNFYNVEVTPAKERAAHLFALLDENDRRYVYVSYDDEEYEMCVPISYNEILELSEFGGYLFKCTHCPRTEGGPWMRGKVWASDELPYDERPYGEGPFYFVLRRMRQSSCCSRRKAPEAEFLAKRY